jgi:hypothetical protein
VIFGSVLTSSFATNTYNLLKAEREAYAAGQRDTLAEFVAVNVMHHDINNDGRSDMIYIDPETQEEQYFLRRRDENFEIVKKTEQYFESKSGVRHYLNGDVRIPNGAKAQTECATTSQYNLYTEAPLCGDVDTTPGEALARVHNNPRAFAQLAYDIEEKTLEQNTAELSQLMNGKYEDDEITQLKVYLRPFASSNQIVYIIKTEEHPDGEIGEITVQSNDPTYQAWEKFFKGAQ